MKTMDSTLPLLFIAILALLLPAVALAGDDQQPGPINLRLTDSNLADALRIAREQAGPADAEAFGEVAVSLQVRGLSRDRYADVLRRAAVGETLEMDDLEGFLAALAAQRIVIDAGGGLGQERLDGFGAELRAVLAQQGGRSRHVRRGHRGSAQRDVLPVETRGTP